MDVKEKASEHSLASLEKRIADLEIDKDRRQTMLGSLLHKRGLAQLSRGSADKQIPLSYQLASSVTTIVGLHEAIASEHRPVRYVWRILICLGIAATMFYLYKSTNEYLEIQTSTSIQLTGATQHEFPPLLLCPKPNFDIDKALALGLTADALKYSLSYLENLFPNQIANVDEARRKFLSVYAMHKFQSLLDYYRAIAPDLNYENASRHGSSYTCRGCKPLDKAEVTILDYRVCYVFHIVPVEPVLGVYSSVRSVDIRYRTNTANLIANWPDWEVYFNPFMESFISVYTKTAVGSFAENTIKFHEQKFVTLHTPETPCRDASDEANYSTAICMAKCHNEIYVETLHCGLLWLSLSTLQSPPTNHCNHLDIVYRLENLTLSKFFKSRINWNIDSKAANECVMHCPRTCNRTIYDTTLQKVEQLPDFEKTMRLGDENDDNVTLIKVALKHSAVYQGGVLVLSEMRTYSFTQLVNNIGGTLGLFVGSTLMTFAELILFLVNYVIGKSRNRKVRQTSQK